MGRIEWVTPNPRDSVPDKWPTRMRPSGAETPFLSAKEDALESGQLTGNDGLVDDAPLPVRVAKREDRPIVTVHCHPCQ